MKHLSKLLSPYKIHNTKIRLKGNGSQNLPENNVASCFIKKSKLLIIGCIKTSDSQNRFAQLVIIDPVKGEERGTKYKIRKSNKFSS